MIDNYVEHESYSELWSVVTGRVNLMRKSSRGAAKFMKGLDGFAGVSTLPDGKKLWLFESENAAKIARNRAESKGIVCGRNIFRFVVNANRVLELADERFE